MKLVNFNYKFYLLLSVQSANYKFYLLLSVQSAKIAECIAINVWNSSLLCNHVYFVCFTYSPSVNSLFSLKCIGIQPCFAFILQRETTFVTSCLLSWTNKAL